MRAHGEVSNAPIRLFHASVDRSGDDLGSQYTRDRLKISALKRRVSKSFHSLFKNKITAPCNSLIPVVLMFLRVNIQAYKVASADFMNWTLLDYVAATGKPMLISTGMTTESDVKKQQNFLIKYMQIMFCYIVILAILHHIKI